MQEVEIVMPDDLDCSCDGSWSYTCQSRFIHAKLEIFLKEAGFIAQSIILFAKETSQIYEPWYFRHAAWHVNDCLVTSTHTVIGRRG